MKISWFSAGVSSAVVTKIALQEHPDLKIIYTHIDDQHEDTLRFIRDCEAWFEHRIEILQSSLRSVEEACLSASFIRSPHGACCTRFLKKRVRKEWERNNPGEHIYFWGLDATEKTRSENLMTSMPEFHHVFPLIEKNMTKSNVHGILEAAGIRRPMMYDLGYPNNNCIGCVKGGMGYWNKIRRDFPKIFEARSLMERTLGAHILKECYLHELHPERGKELKPIVPECGIFCELEEPVPSDR